MRALFAGLVLLVPSLCFGQVVPDEARSCAHPELWLATHSREALPRAWCERCDGCEDGAMPWRLLQAPARAHHCDELEYAALAIGAALGERVTDPSWREHFEALPWVRPRPPTWNPVARENVRWLREAARACRAHEAPLPRGARQRVDRWFAGLRRGEPRIPRRLFVDGRPATREEVLGWLRNPDLFRYDRRTPIRPEPTAPGGEGTLMVATGVPGVECVGADEGCEGFEWIELTFDRRGRLTAIAVAAAACPHLYLIEGGQARHLGTVLSNRNRPSLTGTEERWLPAPTASCEAGALELELREEEPETTYLEALWIEVDGVRVDPVTPVGPTVLRRGDRLRVRFEALPSRCGAFRLFTTGHYVPH